MFFVIGKGTELVGTAGAIIMGVQHVPMLGSIFPTEIALRKNFDKNGGKEINPNLTTSYPHIQSGYSFGDQPLFLYSNFKIGVID